MSIESVARALNRTDVAGTTKLVLIGIANHDGDGGAWPTIATLARYASVGERRVQQCIAELTEAGLVEVERNAGGTAHWRDNRRPNRYTLHLVGVKPSAPQDLGVQSGTSRGESPDGLGVQPTAPKPSSNHPQEPSTSLSTGVDHFEQWWEAFRKTSERPGSKGAASKAWDRLKGDEKVSAMGAINRHHTYVSNFPGRFVMPNGSTWLTQRRWLDERPQEPPNKRSSSAMEHLRKIHAGGAS